MDRKGILLLLILFLALVMAGCAPGPNGLKGAPDANWYVAGFLFGL